MSERIYPPGRDRVIYPPTRNWPGQGSIPLNDLPSAAGTVIDRGILPQLLRQGIGRRGSVHGVEHYAQNFPRLQELKKRSGLYGQGIVERLQNVRDRVKKRVAGQRILPTPYGPRNWPKNMGLARMPSVGAMTDASGPAMGMYPMQSRGDMTFGDGRDLSVHEELDNIGAAGLDFGMSVHVG